MAAMEEVSGVYVRRHAYDEADAGQIIEYADVQVSRTALTARAKGGELKATRFEAHLG